MQGWLSAKAISLQSICSRMYSSCEKRGLSYLHPDWPISVSCLLLHGASILSRVTWTLRASLPDFPSQQSLRKVLRGLLSRLSNPASFPPKHGPHACCSCLEYCLLTSFVSPERPCTSKDGQAGVWRLHTCSSWKTILLNRY